MRAENTRDCAYTSLSSVVEVNAKGATPKGFASMVLQRVNDSTPQGIHPVRIVNRRRHRRPFARAARARVYDHQKRNRRDQRRVHNQRRARHRPHICEGKQHVHLGRLL